MAKRSSAKEAANRYCNDMHPFCFKSQMTVAFLAGVRWARRQAKKRRAGK